MSDNTTAWLVEQIRQGSESAWQDLIRLYSGRLSAFVGVRLRDSHTVDDVVQETLLGFLRSLPHYDSSRDLESYLFTIAAHKIRDHLRKQGRHPLGLLNDLQGDENSAPQISGSIRGPSSILASAERVRGEEERLVDALKAMLEKWRTSGDFRRVKCVELLFVAGWPNRQIAQYLSMTEQQVANYKFQVIESLAKHTSASREPSQ